MTSVRYCIRFHPQSKGERRCNPPSGLSMLVPGVGLDCIHACSGAQCDSLVSVQLATWGDHHKYSWKSEASTKDASILMAMVHLP
jgi:hypothetical protein